MTAFYARLDEDGTTYREPPGDQPGRKKRGTKQPSQKPFIAVTANGELSSTWQTPGKYTVWLRQPGWDMNTRCFVEFDQNQLIGFLEDVVAQLREEPR